MSNGEELLRNRGNDYGKFKDNSTASQGIKRICRQGMRYHELTDSQKEALDNIAIKMSRIINGRSNYIDNWSDIEGYALLVREEMEE